ncbi:MAG TPA: hypothetical protein VFI65_24455 [Streptosporangiaceae bacterium]|nr:hypothetical protein [Streptosporangiaceae bacterium]
MIAKCRFAGAASLTLTLLAVFASPADASLAAGPPLAVGHYTMIKVPGGTNVQAEGISDSGTIVGCDKRKAGGRGFVEKGKKFTVLADPKAGAKAPTCAFSINNRGVIVGQYGSSRFHGFVFDGTRYTAIDEPQAGRGPGQGTIAIDINDAGVIVGYYFTSNGSSRGFVLRNGKFTSISFPEPAGAKNPHTFINGISDNGTMTGFFTDSTGDHISFIDHDGKFRRISVPGAKITSAACISRHTGLIVGGYQTSGSAPFRGFILRHGIYRTLQAAPGKKSTEPQCVNDHGVVVGSVNGKNGSSSGFLFTPGK